ncbi:cytochrome P450 9b1 [Culex quinquefasciatus]|uniref:Cytochrome P450 9b1 n=1 Tax=Culex quinquefasciatus TaxID=7176 RepID=B0W6Y4_CULQU|nr:cytochrome P450 9b1 [Culex quinquefasciatus]|eukprot:XP_001844468.1 cytochrome P450 9b1 [Culex quinquefasciatus]
MEIDLGVLVPLVLIVGFLYRLLTKNNGYFHDKPIPSMAVKPLLGSTGPLTLKKYTLAGFVEYIYNKYPGAKVFGLFDNITPIFVVRDPELIKKITIKDFDHFIDHRQVFGNGDNDSPYVLFGKTLFAMTGQKWRDMRATLSPAFTGSKMRQMFELVIECCESVTQFQLKQSKNIQTVEVSEMYKRFSTDVIASCAFGVSLDSFRDPDNDFYRNGKQMMRFERLSVALRIFANQFFPTLVGKLGIDVIDREHNRYFSGLIMNAIRERNSKGIVRNDLINLLLQARAGLLKHQQEKEQHADGFATALESDLGKVNSAFNMTDTEMIAQAFVFFLAGFETVSTSLMLATHDLVLHQDVQQKLFEEIQETEAALDGKKLNYETLQKMQYMDMVVSESLRMRPAAVFLDRVCVRDYVLDDGEGLKFTIDRGTAVWIPTHGIHRDPKYFPNPEKFDPERFSPENRQSIDPLTYLPFGLGPRNCIGSRFALMEIKASLYYLLLNFKVVKNDKTPNPLKFRKGFTIAAPDEDVFVDLVKRQP